MAALTVAGIFVVLGNTEPATTVRPEVVEPGQTISLAQADAVAAQPQHQDGKVSVLVTFVNTQDVVLQGYQSMFTITRGDDTVAAEQVEFVEPEINAAVGAPNPGVPFQVTISVADEPGTQLVFNDLTLRKSSLDMSTRWLDPTPAATLELS